MHNNKDQRHEVIIAKRFWIIGAGRFGQMAMERIARKIPHAVITVVDKRPALIDSDGITTINEDGIQWLNAMLDQDAKVDMIIPAVPVHVVSEWLKIKILDLFDIHTLEIPETWIARMPHATRGKVGQAFVSHADFLCPDSCAEPENICTHTGKPRPLDLFRLLGHVDDDDVFPIVIRSHQLLPGVGGILPADMISLTDTVFEHSHRPMMIATACRCHGVVDFMQLKNKSGATGQR